MEFPFQVVSKKYSTLFSAKFGPFRTRSGAVCRPCTMNVRNKPVQEMFCVVKCETSPVLRWKLCEFQDRKSISISGINLIVWRGSQLRSGFENRFEICIYPLEDLKRCMFVSFMKNSKLYYYTDSRKFVKNCCQKRPT